VLVTAIAPEVDTSSAAAAVVATSAIFLVFVNK